MYQYQSRTNGITSLAQRVKYRMRISG